MGLADGAVRPSLGRCAAGVVLSPWGFVHKLLLLIGRLWKSELRDAIRLALERETPRLSSVAWLLKKHNAAAKQKRPFPLTLSHRPELTELVIQPRTRRYGELFRSDDDNE